MCYAINKIKIYIVNLSLSIVYYSRNIEFIGIISKI